MAGTFSRGTRPVNATLRRSSRDTTSRSGWKLGAVADDQDAHLGRMLTQQIGSRQERLEVVRHPNRPDVARQYIVGPQAQLRAGGIPIRRLPERRFDAVGNPVQLVRVDSARQQGSDERLGQADDCGGVAIHPELEPFEQPKRERFASSRPPRESTPATGPAARRPTASAALACRARSPRRRRTAARCRRRRRSGRAARRATPPSGQTTGSSRCARRLPGSAPGTSRRDGRECRRPDRGDTSTGGSPRTGGRTDGWARRSRRGPRGRPSPMRGSARTCGSPARSPPAGSSV